jgi:hypothetical protein
MRIEQVATMQLGLANVLNEERKMRNKEKMHGEA